MARVPATCLVGNGGHATIQAAIDAAQNGDTVLVANGSYTENVTLKSGVSLSGEIPSWGRDPTGRWPRRHPSTTQPSAI